jgi:excisionase family DNA binding protein
MSGPAPFGTQWVDGRLMPDAAEVGIVRDLVEAFLNSAGRAKATATALNAKGLTTRRGTSWTDIAVARVIRNPALRDLVTEDQWKLLAELLHAREVPGAAPTRQSVHPLGGVVRCSCGGRMYLRGDGPAGKFCCRICRAKISQETLERLFVEGLADVELPVGEVVEASAGNPRAAELSRMLGGEPVAVSEIWPALDRDQARQLVELLVARIVVGRDEVSIGLAENGDSAPKSTPSPGNSLPSTHGSEPAARSSTRRSSEKSRPEEPTRRIVEPKAYRISHVAALLDLPKSTVYDLVRTGALASIRAGTNGGVVLVPASSVAELLEKKRGRK